MSNELFVVVVNDEDQYSIWPADRDTPPGWAAVGRAGDREHCLRDIEQRWSDMRPRSLREAMKADAKDSP